MEIRLRWGGKFSVEKKETGSGTLARTSNPAKNWLKAGGEDGFIRNCRLQSRGGAWRPMGGIGHKIRNPHLNKSGKLARGEGQVRVGKKG